MGRGRTVMRVVALVELETQWVPITVMVSANYVMDAFLPSSQFCL